MDVGGGDACRPLLRSWTLPEPELITQETKGSEKHYYFADKITLFKLAYFPVGQVYRWTGERKFKPARHWELPLGENKKHSLAQSFAQITD